MSDKPEFPPNCPYFERYSAECGWRLNIPGSGGPFVWISELDGKAHTGLVLSWKPIIAAVGESYWRKESRRIDVELTAMCERNIHKYGANRPESTGALRLSIEHADNQAILWQKMNDPASPLWETFK